MPSPGSAINPYLYYISIFETKKIFFREWTSKNIFDRHVSCRLSQVTGNQHIKSGLSKVFHYLLKIARQLFSQLLFFFVDCINFQPPLQGSFQFIYLCNFKVRKSSAILRNRDYIWHLIINNFWHLIITRQHLDNA